MIEEIMKPVERLLIVEPETPSSDVMYKMSKKEEGRALVLTDGVLEGIVSRRDLTHLINKQIQLQQ